MTKTKAKTKAKKKEVAYTKMWTCESGNIRVEELEIYDQDLEEKKSGSFLRDMYEMRIYSKGKLVHSERYPLFRGREYAIGIVRSFEIAQEEPGKNDKKNQKKKTAKKKEEDEGRLWRVRMGSGIAYAVRFPGGANYYNIPF